MTGREVGTPLAAIGDYDLLEPIARGGMGLVYRARQRSLNREVALKMVRSGQFADAEEVRRFKTEAEAAARLDHPNIARVYYVGEERGLRYIVFEYIEGWYNPHRRHSALDYESPTSYEKKHRPAA